MSAEQTRRLLESYFQSPSPDLYAEDAEFHDMSQPRPLRGRQEIGDFLRMFHEEAFPGGGYELRSLLVEESSAAAEWTFRGVNTGAAMGGPATGRAVEFHGSTHYQLSDGRITRARVYYDTGSLASQLGLTGSRLPNTERERWFEWWRERGE